MNRVRGVRGVRGVQLNNDRDLYYYPQCNRYCPQCNRHVDLIVNFFSSLFLKLELPSVLAYQLEFFFLTVFAPFTIISVFILLNLFFKNQHLCDRCSSGQHSQTASHHDADTMLHGAQRNSSCGATQYSPSTHTG
jgi:hypothetical protein